MPSPFPWMGPYLEAHWRDVHASLVIYIRDILQDLLPPELRVGMARSSAGVNAASANSSGGTTARTTATTVIPCTTT